MAKNRINQWACCTHSAVRGAVQQHVALIARAICVVCCSTPFDTSIWCEWMLITYTCTTKHATHNWISLNREGIWCIVMQLLCDCMHVTIYFEICLICRMIAQWPKHAFTWTRSFRTSLSTDPSGSNPILFVYTGTNLEFPETIIVGLLPVVEVTALAVVYFYMYTIQKYWPRNNILGYCSMKSYGLPSIIYTFFFSP